MKNSNPASTENAVEETDHYVRESNTRNVCFVFPDGNRKFLNYGYLVSGDYMPDAGLITLEFTNCTITLNGIHLEALFYEFMQHLPKEIKCVEDRYNALEEKERPVVNKIKILNNNSE